MKPNGQKNRRRISPWIFGAFVLVSLTVLVLLQTSNLWKDVSVETASDTLLLYALSSLNFIAFVIFGFIFLRNIVKLARERKALQLGSKIKTRLLLYFAAISILPIIAMAGFSYLFMNRALERWFTQIPENVVREARDVQNRLAAEQHARLQASAQMLAASLEDRSVSDYDLDRLAETGNLTRIELLGRDNTVIATSSSRVNLQSRPELEDEIALIRAGSFDHPLLRDGAGIDAAIAAMSDGRKLVIIPDLGPAQSVSQMFDNSLVEFDRLKGGQITVRQVGFLTLGVLTFLLIFASTWTAFHLARGLTVPIKALAEGADEIAHGNLWHRVDVLAEDELALLVAAFNQMSAKLEENSAELSERRRYIETVLETLPTGVISLDQDNRIGTINRSALNMLRLANADLAGSELGKLVRNENLAALEKVIARARRVGHASEQTTLRPIEEESTEPILPVALTAAALPNGKGTVLVLEDLSELIAAQRASAWQEVARRMAHEIKNPLTPIQLSAERIAKRFADRNGGPDAIHQTDGQTVKVIADGTNTILREVQSLKFMVDEFSRYARLPNARLEPGDLNEIARHVVGLYQGRDDLPVIGLIPEPDLPEVMADAEQMKRVFVNLIDNAVESFDESDTDKKITIRTRRDPAKNIVLIEVCDNGKGINPANFQKLFQPYFSTKGRGTGLGLAIVERIVLEHEGKIYASANTPKGAKFSIELPMA